MSAQLLAVEVPLVFGVPAHPLVVHGAVVLIPVAALGVLLMAVWPKFGARFGWLVTLAAFLAAGAAVAAKLSGEQLAELVGAPGFDHAELGDTMPIFAAALALVALILWLVQRSYVKGGRGRGLVVIVGLLAAAVAVANLFWVTRVGHSGAESVWTPKVAVATAPTPTATTSATPSPSPTDDASPSPTDDASPSPTDDGTYTAAEVADHNSSGDCWTSIDGAVYDLTDWEDKHPGGAARIIALCGTDGSSAFDDQHAGEPKPADMLAEYQVGVLAQ